MSSTKSMPREIVTIRNKAIEFATGNGPRPYNIDDLYEWLVWESESPVPPYGASASSIATYLTSSFTTPTGF